jgi:hypothetical protein
MNNTAALKAHEIAPETTTPNLVLVTGDPQPHPATDMIPAPDADQFAELLEDIRKHGLLVKIELLDGMVIDGRSRLRACRELGIKPECIDVTGIESPVSYCVSKNVKRRHLNAKQRAMFAFKALPTFAAEAKKRQGTHKALPDGSSGMLRHEGEATARVARVYGAGITAVKDIATMSRKAPDVVDAEESFETVADMKRVAALPEAQRVEAIAAAKKPKPKSKPKAKAAKLTSKDKSVEPAPTKKADRCLASKGARIFITSKGGWISVNIGGTKVTFGMEKFLPSPRSQKALFAYIDNGKARFTTGHGRPLDDKK